MSKTHWASCDRANESDNTDWWSDTACGLDTYQHENLSLDDNINYVTCKRCLNKHEQSKKKTETQGNQH